MKFIEESLQVYCEQHSHPSSALCEELAQYTRDHVHGSQMLIGPMEGAVLGLLIKLTGAKNILEFGTYTGYSALTMAEHLPSDGLITTVDINQETTQIAQKFWERSAHKAKIQSITKSGVEFIQNNNTVYDLIFIDADKNNYPTYLAWALKHVRKGGLIISDNTLWSGKVLDATPDKQTNSILEHNQLAIKATGFYPLLLPVRDGMMILLNQDNHN